EHCRIYPVLTFNGGNYDIPLMRGFGLFQALKEASGKPVNIMKKGSTYREVKTSKLRLTDVLMYSPLRCNLRNFLATFGDTGDSKGLFCYQKLKSYKDLDTEIEKIKYEDFKDDFADGNQLSEPYKRYAQLIRKGQTESSALKNMGLAKRPSRGRDEFWKLKEEWRRSGFRTLKDVLRAYSVRDTAPLVRACYTFQASFAELKLGHVFNGFISLPQLSLYYIL
ncbi:MAG: hypothetical protein GY739_04570, partial [Mesoflavibacter sp.]|nr:hypothetical protein [Mesoflavibacter sp.]